MTTHFTVAPKLRMGGVLPPSPHPAFGTKCLSIRTLPLHYNIMKRLWYSFNFMSCPRSTNQIKILFKLSIWNNAQTWIRDAETDSDEQFSRDEGTKRFQFLTKCLKSCICISGTGDRVSKASIQDLLLSHGTTTEQAQGEVWRGDASQNKIK